MRLSDERISHLAQAIMKALRSSQSAQLPNEHLAYQEIKRLLKGLFEDDGGVEAKIRQRIQSLTRKVPEDSREWDILYRKYLEEEQRKKRL